MMLFLCGQDTFRSWRKLKEIIAHYEEAGKHNLNFRKFDSENVDFSEFEAELETNSMFKEKKFIILEDVFSRKDFAEKFLEKKAKFLKSDDIILFYEGENVKKTDPLFKFLREKSRFQEFELLEGQALVSWIGVEAESLSAKITKTAAERLAEFTGPDLWRASNELKKLASYKRGGQIEEDDVKNLVKARIENDIFKTIDALTENKKDKALMLIHRHLEEGDAPLYLLSMINFQFRNILAVKDLMEKNVPQSELIRRSGLHPFVARKSFFQAQKFTMPRLKKIYHRLLQVDLSLKTGKIDPESALDLLIAGI